MLPSETLLQAPCGWQADPLSHGHQHTARPPHHRLRKQ